MEKQTHPLPKRLIQYNELVRIINFDSSIDGFIFIQTHKEWDAENKVHRIYAFRQDVKEDRIRIWKKSEAFYIKKKKEVTFPVRQGCYQLFGKGELSQDLSIAIILPKRPDDYKLGIRQRTSWINAFSILLTQEIVESNILANLEGGISMLGEHISKAEPDRIREKHFNEMQRIAKEFNLSGDKSRTEPEQKKANQ